MQKRAQLQLSFGMIFSVIIIAVTLAVAIYVIVVFLNQNKNIECKTFVTDLNDKLTSMYSSDAAQNNVFSGGVTTDTKKVCFGYINQSGLTSDDNNVLNEIRNFADKNSNFYFYPRNACGKTTFRYTLNHAKTDNFFCVGVSKGKVSVKLSIGSYDSSIKISK
jgi:hypothetical protein